MENLNLSRRFSLDFRAVLTWTTALEKASQAGNGSAPAILPTPAGAGPGTASESKSHCYKRLSRLKFISSRAMCDTWLPLCQAAEVQGHIELDVYSEVLGPFRIIPRGVLEAGGNTVMSALVNNLLPVFLRRCAALQIHSTHLHLCSGV